MASSTIILQLPRCVRRRLELGSTKTHNKVEYRRCQIVLQWATGRTPEQIAESFGCAVCTVYRMVRAFRQRGEAALVHRTSPRQPRKVTPEHEIALDDAIQLDPRQLGQNFSNWTAHRLALCVKVKVHAEAILRHLWALRWRWRRPVSRVACPDPRYRAKAQYLKRLRRQARHGQIYHYRPDEMDAALLPTISARWMRVGQQTEIDMPGQNAKQPILGEVNQVTGVLIWMPWTNKNNVGFRQSLKRVLDQHAFEATKVVMLLDNYRIHKAKTLQEWQRRHRREFRLYVLPTYSPRLNRIERVWRRFRRNVTDNYFFKTMPHLMRAVEAFLTE